MKKILLGLLLFVSLVSNAQLSGGGGGGASIVQWVNANSNLTATINTGYAVTTAASTIVITLPTAVSQNGRDITVKKVDAGIGTLSVITTSAQTIDGQLSYSISSQFNMATFRSDGSNWLVVNVNSGVASEFGSVILANQVFSTNSFVNSTNGTFTIPSAGVWKLRYDISTDGTGANTNTHIQIVNSVGTLVLGTERTRGGSVTSALILTAEVIVTTTGATTYTLQGRNGGSGSITLQNGANNNSTITWEKVSGFVPITGSTVDFKTVSGWNVSGITAFTDAVFTNIGAGNIPYSAGLFTLTAGKTYEITGHLEGTLTGNTGTDWQQFILCDAAGTQIPSSPTGIILGTANSSQWQNNQTISTIFTPTVTTQVKLRLNNRGSSASFSTNGGLQSGSGCWMTVTQIGSSSWTGLNLTTTGSGAANYNSSTSTLNIPSVTGKILILNTGNLTGVLNGVTFSTTWADPISFTTSSNMTGFISSDITIQSNTVNIDAWLTGLSSGTGARLQRWKNVQSATNITFGIYNTTYSCNFNGFVTIGAFEYKISGYTHGGVLNKMYIELMQ